MPEGVALYHSEHSRDADGTIGTGVTTGSHGSAWVVVWERPKPTGTSRQCVELVSAVINRMEAELYASGHDREKHQDALHCLYDALEAVQAIR